MTLSQNIRYETPQASLDKLELFEEDFLALKKEVLSNNEVPQDIKTLEYKGRTYTYYEGLQYEDIIKRYITRSNALSLEEKEEMSKVLEGRIFTPEEERIALDALDQEIEKKMGDILTALNTKQYASSYISLILNTVEHIDIISSNGDVMSLTPKQYGSDLQLMNLESQKKQLEQDLATKEEITTIDKKISQRKGELSPAALLFQMTQGKATQCTSTEISFKANPFKKSTGELTYFPSDNLKNLRVTISE